ncbi:MAG TPA: N-acetyltransferase, partial [Bacteroidales bacterium]|nr:N-acetyltransferase [Bacteroidales bacterium]
MGEVTISQVNGRKELNTFIDFPFTLYRGNAYWVPPLKSDERNSLRHDRNPAFEYCEAAYWLARIDGKVAGRIAAIINRNECSRWNTRLVRFGWFDFIDDRRVSEALIETARQWGRERGMTGMHGPLGFTDMDPEGMVIDGFDQLSSLSALYNFPYYVGHMESLGFRKAVDWVQFEMDVPNEVPEKINRLNRIVLERYNLHMLKATKARDIRPYAAKLFAMYNTSFHDIYGFTALTDQQIAEYTRQYFGFIRPEYVSMVIDR